MNAPIRSRHLKRPRQSRQHYRSIDKRDQHYELLKSQLAASAKTPAEYDAAVRQAARIAGV
ncbi:MAG: hypothetical protein A3K04_09665 [Gallionellales bacterium RBG_16_56_9]|nr:MAG: hypothetical protein A3K04_09665 [Gallionellales bacterium RBG_16_56_9]